MKKIIMLIACILVGSPWASAQEAAAPAGEYRLGTPFEGDVAFGYRWVTREGSRAAREYEYLHSSLAGHVEIEYDPLPHRLLFETFVENEHDYYTELDYSYSDVVMFNFTGRKFFRNLHHLTLPPDAPASSATDFNPGAEYFNDTGMNRALLRLKAPDFPLHLYLEAKVQEKHGTVQQRFMRSFTAGDRASEARDIDFETTETRATVNSHLNFIEFEYSHAQKEFENTRDKALTDTTTVAYPHNQYSTTESSTDTVKVHTSHTGRVAAAATYSTGERENKDSGVKAEFVNAGADLSWIPTRDLTLAVKFRRHEVTQTAPLSVFEQVASAPSGTNISVRDAIGFTRDALSGFVRLRATDRLVLRAEVALDTYSRDFEAGAWALDKEISRQTARVGATYRFANRLMLRGDLSHQTADAPQASEDNTYFDATDTARGTLTWTPASWYSLLLSGATVREKRDLAGTTFTGTRERERNFGQGSMTFLVGKKTAIIPSYAFFQNKQTAPIAYTDASLGITVESDVPYADTAHMASLAVTHAMTDIVTVTADTSRTWTRGSWSNAGTVPGSAGIEAFSNLREVVTEAGGEVGLRFSKNMGTDLRYRYRRIDDKIDDAEDGTAQIMLATLRVLW